MENEEECSDNCSFLRRARTLGLDSLPGLSQLNQKARSSFAHLFNPLSRDFPALFPILFESIPVPVRNKAEENYYLKAWLLIYQHLLQVAQKRSTENSNLNNRRQYD